ncbi:MAG: two-component system, NarL family, sensor histidine kinase BarA [Parcubacteria bacterium C7867-003]|nr:MAG: two-component system, NarL family, sensor histidine kinase BarA [Parcubacteria bacterium C7867-003]
MVISIYVLLCWFSAIIIAGLGILIYELSKKTQSAQLFSFLAFSVSIWSFSIPINSPLGIRFSYFLATLISTIFLLFALSYPEEKKINKNILIILSLIEIFFICLLFLTDFIIAKSVEFNSADYVGWNYGNLWFILDFYIGISWLTGIGLILKKFLSAKTKELKTNLRYVLITVIIGIIPPIITGLLLPRLGIFNYYWLAPVSGLLWFMVIFYSITRYHLFNIKIIAVELVTFSLWIFLLVRTIMSDTQEDMWIDGSLFVVSIILGVMLIRSVLSETKQREQIEFLMKDVKTAYDKVKEMNDHLADKINEQTKDVRRAYEVEKEARAELEELNKTKDQFITSTQHHLRTPMTSLKWGLESIRSGAGGPVTPELSRILDTTEASMNQMTETIENFIHITEKKV